MDEKGKTIYLLSSSKREKTVEDSRGSLKNNGPHTA